MGNSIKLEGVNELVIKLKKNMNLDPVKTVVKMRGANLQQKAMRKAPYDTHTLERSIKLDIIDQGLTALITANTDYAGYQEHGTRYMEAQPYMKPAFNEEAPKFKSDIDKLMK